MTLRTIPPIFRKEFIRKTFQEQELGKVDTWADLRQLNTIPSELYSRIMCCLDEPTRKTLELASKGIRNRTQEASLKAKWIEIRVTNDMTGFYHLLEVAYNNFICSYPETLWFEPRRLTNAGQMASTLPPWLDTSISDSFPATSQISDAVKKISNIKTIVIEYCRSPRSANGTSGKFLQIIFSALTDAGTQPEYLYLFTKDSIQPTTELLTVVPCEYYTPPSNVRIVWYKLVFLAVGEPSDGPSREYIAHMFASLFLDAWKLKYLLWHGSPVHPMCQWWRRLMRLAIDPFDGKDSKEGTGVDLWRLSIEYVDISTEDLIRFLELHGKYLTTLTLYRVYAPEGGWRKVLELLKDKTICPKVQRVRLVVGRILVNTQQIQMHSDKLEYDTDNPQLNNIDQAITRCEELGY
ncbi:hypothetical protein AtubIFM56815_005087 [Aspergillus tubingensis]|uniref:Uncharacterized protein n=1 Tax=Aspergillus tubingensis TaxID=5068 RepID=A0A8H3SXX2_ASPTU|nr:beta-ketoacyl synthase, N-terminal domain family protein [Aspergillus tubingensis]GFN16919.1 beta-ketoacyl synthase, N-terminal domain family protein [Aspergillus tubingensis]GLA81436.1 hypothetical protein AtubIFM56815_005087 [Aspergillus tubingensis]